MKEVCELSLQIELQKIAELDIRDISYKSLSIEQSSHLAKKIGLLPLEYQNILLLRYCFDNTIPEIDKVLGIENSEGKIRYIQKMLSNLMDLKNIWIDNESMREACKLVLVENMKEYDNLEALLKPNYSDAFRRKLKDIKIAQNTTSILRLIAKRVAIFMLICLVSFSTVLVVNAEAREKFFDWIIEIFPEFSIFTPQSINENNSLADPTSLKINYIPEGFKLLDPSEGRKMLVYNYLDEDNRKLTIKLFASSDTGNSYYDTENIEIEEFNFKGSQAYTWQTNKMTYLIWYQDGIECHITGDLSKDEIIKVAENISK